MPRLSRCTLPTLLFVGGRSMAPAGGGGNAGKGGDTQAAGGSHGGTPFDLNTFIKDAVTRGYVQNSWSLTKVLSGFEIWNGGVGLQTADFAVTVN
jgi:hypothetical protein